MILLLFEKSVAVPAGITIPLIAADGTKSSITIAFPNIFYSRRSRSLASRFGQYFLTETSNKQHNLPGLNISETLT